MIATFRFARSPAEPVQAFRDRCRESLDAAGVWLPHDIDAKLRAAVSDTTSAVTVRADDAPGPPEARIVWLN